MKFLRNTWYAAAYSREIGEQPMARQFLDEHVMLLRKMDGTVAAISNICPHRFAPLNRGIRTGDIVECPYHGLQYGPDGKCVHNPHTDRLDRKMDVKAYPLVERFGLAWIWMGDGEPDPALIPDMSDMTDQEGRSVCRSFLDASYRYDILIDNLLDISHADYLHRGSFSAGSAEETTLDVLEEANDKVVILRQQKRTDPPPYLPEYTEKVDFLTQISWSPSQVVLFRSGFGPVGEPVQAMNGYSFYHIATPASADRTHYFMGIVREGPPDPEADADLAEFQRGVVERDDGPMLEFLHNYMAGRELMDMKPLILPVDSGALKVRRVMKRRLDMETESV